MATIADEPTVQLAATFRLTEPELRALDALVGYGTDAFLEAFREKLGRAYIDRHEDGLRTLFDSVRDKVPGILSRADEARLVFHRGRLGL